MPHLPRERGKAPVAYGAVSIPTQGEPRPDPFDVEGWRRHFIARSPLDEVRTREIADGFFAATVPRRLRGVLERYGLQDRAVLDVGCSYGQALRYFRADSLGIDTDPECVRVATALGFDARLASIDDPDLGDVLPAERFDAVWCCDVLEHVAAPHTALIQIRRVLRPGGLAFLRVPLIPRSRILAAAQRTGFRFLFGWQRFGLGYEALDHVNAFTSQTFEFGVARAGFRVVARDATVTARPVLRPIANRLLRNSANTMLFVAERLDNWSYPERKSSRRLTEHGWTYRDAVTR